MSHSTNIQKCMCTYTYVFKNFNLIQLLAQFERSAIYIYKLCLSVCLCLSCFFMTARLWTTDFVSKLWTMLIKSVLCSSLDVIKADMLFAASSCINSLVISHGLSKDILHPLFMKYNQKNPEFVLDRWNRAWLGFSVLWMGALGHGMVSSWLLLW